MLKKLTYLSKKLFHSNNYFEFATFFEFSLLFLKSDLRCPTEVNDLLNENEVSQKR